MHLERVDLYLCDFESEGFNYSTWSKVKTQALVYKLSSNNKVGWGESAVKYKALPMALRKARKLIGHDVSQLHSLLDPDLLSRKDLYHWYTGADRRWRQVREGYSIALLDLLGQLTRRTVYELLAIDAKRSRYSLMPVIHVFTLEDTLELVKTWVNNGFKYIKLKLSGQPDRDIITVETLKVAYPDIKILIADANLGYKKEEDVIQAAKAFKQFNVGYFQNPIRTRPSNYYKLSREADFPFTSDVQSYWPKVKSVVDQGAAKLINLHPNLMAGMDYMIKIIDYANTHNIPSIIGSSGLLGIQDRAFQAMAAYTDSNFPSENFGLDLYFSPERAKYYYSKQGTPEIILNKNSVVEGEMTIDVNCHGFGTLVNEDLLARRTVQQWTFRA